MERRSATAIFAFLILSVCAQLVQARQIYVYPQQQLSESILNFVVESVQSPQYPNIQAAIDDACDGDIIYLAPGRFKGDGNRDLDFKGKAITVSGLDPNDPNVVAATIIDCNGTETDMHRGFYFHSGEDANSVIRGLTIKNGWQNLGGGVLCEYASPIISHCNIIDCSANNNGAAVDSEYSSPVLTDCNIVGNKITSAIRLYNYYMAYSEDSNQILIQNCIIKDNVSNSSSRYGGIYCSGGYVNIVNCRIENNQYYGIYGSYGLVNIRGCQIVSNGISDSSQKAGIGSGQSCRMTIEDSEITGNFGIGISHCESVKNCTVSYNLGRGLSECRGEIVDCSIIGNGSDGIYNPYNYYASDIINCVIADNNGCGVYYSSGTQKLTNCTIVDNNASGVVIGSATVSITNCIVRNNTGWQITGVKSTTKITYTNSYDGTGSLWYGGFPGAGNIDCDPCFVSNADFHIRSDSKCVDAGTNDANFVTEANDIEGTTRILDGNGDGIAKADMGAYEYDDSRPLISAWADRILYLNNAQPQPQNILFVKNAGSGVLNYYIESDCNWLTIIPAQGVSSSEIQQADVLIDTNGLEFGDYVCTVKIYDSNALNNPMIVLLNVHIGNLWTVPTDFNTIQAAVNAAQSYDHICVLDGIYTGSGNDNVDFIGKNLVLYSKNGPKNCIIDCNFSSNGGFKFTSGESLGTVLDGFLIKNVSTAIHCEGSSPTIINCNFLETVTTINSYDCDTLFIKNCDMNSAFLAISGSHIGKLLVEDCNMISTKFIGGGIIYIMMEDVKDAQVTNSIMTGNGQNTGLYFYGTQLTVNNCRITGTKIACRSYAWKTDFTNCTFTQNYNSSGKTIQCDVYGPTPQVNFTNCILWDESNSISISPSTAANITYSDIRGGWDGIGNIDCDPCFAELGYLDDNDTLDSHDDFWVEGDYHLKSQGWRWDETANQWTWDNVTSRCIDAGSPGYPLGEEPMTLPVDPLNRFGVNKRIDMGCYGRTAETSMPPYDWALLSDMDNSGKVNFADYSYLTQFYGSSGEKLDGDLNRDGRIDLEDIYLIVADWLDNTDWVLSL